MELTREYFDKQLRKLVTKGDLKGLVTKEELKRLATKEDLKGLATKSELNLLATKEDIKEVKALIEDEVGDLARMTSNRFDEMEAKLEIKAEGKNLNSRVVRIEQALNIK